MATNKDFNIRLRTKGDKKAKRALGGVTSSIKSMVGTVASVYTLKKGFDATIKAAAKQEKIFKGLQTAVENTGKSWDSAKGELDSMFASLQATTEYGDTESAQMLQSLIEYTGDYETATENMSLLTDMASSSMFNQQSAAKYLGQALAGNVSTLGRYIPELRTANNEQLKHMDTAEKAEYAQKLLNEKFGGTAQENLDTVTGQYKQMKNYLGDMGEAIGDEVLPVMNDLLGSTVEWFQELSETTLETAVRQLQEMGMAAKELKGLQYAVEVENAFKTIQTTSKDIKTQMKDVNYLLGKDIVESLGLVWKKYDEWVDIGMREVKTSREGVENFDIASLKAEDINEQLQNIVENNKILFSNTTDLTLEQEKQINIATNQIKALSKLLKLVKQRNAATKRLGVNEDKIQEKLNNQVNSLISLTNWTDTWNQKTKETSDIFGRDLVENTNETATSLGTVQRNMEETTREANQQVTHFARTSELAQTMAGSLATWEGVKELNTDLEVTAADFVNISTELETVTNAFELSNERKTQLLSQFSDQYRATIKGNYSLEMKNIERNAELYKRAGADEIKVAKWTAEKKKKLNTQTAQQAAATFADSAKAMADAGMVSGKVAKRAAQAQAVVDTYAAANAAYKAMAGIPVIGPALGAAAAAAAIGAGLANVAQIEQQKYAQGGIVSGTGNRDTQPIMATPGEMVLNTDQQKELFNLAKGEGETSNNITVNIQGDFLGNEQQADKLANVIEKRSKRGFNKIAVT